MDEIRFGELSAKVQNSLDVWDKTLDSVGAAAMSFNTLSQSADDTVAEFTEILRTNKKDLSEAILALNIAMGKTGQFLDSGSSLVGNTEIRIQQLTTQLMITLQKLDRTADKLNLAIDQIADQPSQLLFGKPLPTRNTPDP